MKFKLRFESYFLLTRFFFYFSDCRFVSSLRAGLMHEFITGVIDAPGDGKESSDSSKVLSESLKQKYEESYLLLFYGIGILRAVPQKDNSLCLHQMQLSYTLSIDQRPSYFTTKPLTPVPCAICAVLFRTDPSSFVAIRILC